MHDSRPCVYCSYCLHNVKVCASFNFRDLLYCGCRSTLCLLLHVWLSTTTTGLLPPLRLMHMLPVTLKHSNLSILIVEMAYNVPFCSPFFSSLLLRPYLPFSLPSFLPSIPPTSPSLIPCPTQLDSTCEMCGDGLCRKALPPCRTTLLQWPSSTEVSCHSHIADTPPLTEVPQM